jgi:zinc/manganese transport system permease protein
MRGGWNIAWYDFLFYLAFGVTVTFSVPVAGVLLVFTFLVVPAIIAVMFSERPVVMMLIAWTTGMMACTAGLAVSYAWDMPTGPLVVCTFAATLAAAGVTRRLTAPGAGEVERQVSQGGPQR